MSRTIRIGTRDSELALWQATTVQNALEKTGHKTELVPVKSTGDLNLDQPLYEMGITGIFTKTLDVAMIKGEVDIAVHSMKDVPTALPKGIVEGAVMKRANTKDILIHKGLDFLDSESGTIATGSLRRKAQWLHRHPGHKVVDLRGNVNTRMQKLEASDWNGAIFAAAGLERIDIKPHNFIDLDWMIPAPAQGAMLIVAMEEDNHCRKALAGLHHRNSGIEVHVERQFLRKLEGGCTAPIGALARIHKDELHFKGALFSLDGKQKIEVERSVSIDQIEDFGISCAEHILENGGKELMTHIKSILNN
ncbi:hydroxymethylbilane synthase [Gramella sp. GC03-9]|uniref:Hydroxymethylbilane synthase n=1 Tax=Christiangramia oceanisediminis TaxID=2920386 RepID=A0A9X2I7U9_9FLAO|nr:hydroxymethylbilane synthase [Gramella oceanisediminis]MCP9199374.1 hydroxymethylbilane synthase [Gramella oceanisediminis]